MRKSLIFDCIAVLSLQAILSYYLWTDMDKGRLDKWFVMSICVTSLVGGLHIGIKITTARFMKIIDNQIASRAKLADDIITAMNNKEYTTHDLHSN